MSTFADAVLATDADLTKYESKMPALAVKMNVYAGKRDLAKLYIGKRLRQRGVDLAKIEDPFQLNSAAVFKELELIFRDLSDKQEAISHEKAQYYARLFDEEMELIILDLTDGTTVTPTVTSIPCYRA